MQPPGAAGSVAAMSGPRYRAALITGATHGIGAATARRLAPVVEVLFVHGIESESAVAGTLDELRAGNAGTEVVYLRADFDRLAAVDALAEAVVGHGAGLDLLVNNAGRPGADRRTLTPDGHEATFQTNYLALVALTSALLGTLADADRARIVNVSSRTHLSATLALDDLELERGYSAVAAYAHSKLAIVTYTCWLARRLESGPIEAASLHPGVISTGLLHAMFCTGGAPADVGARNIMSLVERPGPVNGEYFDEDQRSDPNPEALSVENQEGLVDATARMLTAAGAPVPTVA
jgi:NAD(P)-dependent dehydrogenase (short-subunit alcohol dehydrogenase family)